MFILLCYSPALPGHTHHVQLLLDKRAIEEIPRSTPGFYSRIFLARKKSGDWRPVIDLSALNRFLRSPHFRMETSALIMRLLQPGHWTFTSLRAPPAIKWQQLICHMTSLEKLTLRGRLHMRPLQFALRDNWGPVIGPPLYTGTHSTGCPLSFAVVGYPPQLTTGVPPTSPLPQLQLFSDASIEGWGAHLTSHQTSGTWSPRQSSLHINDLELLAVHFALQHFPPLVINKVVIVMTDNTTVIGQIKNQGGTHSRSLYHQTVLPLEWADSKRITLVPRHFPGHLNMVANR